MLHERPSEAGETVFILKERAAELVCSDRDLEMENVHSIMNELSTSLEICPEMHTTTKMA